MENPNPATKRCTQEILKQMDSIFYKINENIGFFCKIKYKNKNIPVMMINKYINDEEIQLLNNISINNEKLEIDKIINKSIEYNFTIIKIKKNNNISFIEMDDKLYENEFKTYYNKESIYILQCNDLNNPLVSFGIIKGINKEKFKYTGYINSKYSIIFNLSNNKLLIKKYIS